MTARASPSSNMSREKPEKLLAFAQKLADASGKVILPFFRTDLSVENKTDAGFDPLTEADKAGEKVIRELIELEYPSHGIEGEEFGLRNADAPQRWTVDPIDGTRGFMAGIPLWGTLIAFSIEDAPLLGLIDQPFTGERFIGIHWGDAKRAELSRSGARRPLKTRPCASLADATLATTSPFLFEGDGEQAAYKAVETGCRFARYSTDCYGYAMLAAGQIDVVIESGLSPHDILAHIPLIKASGGIVTDWSGGNPSGGGQIIAAGDPRCHEQALKILSRAAKPT